MSRRALASLLLGGCLLVLLVEAPSALREVRFGLRGPYTVQAADAAPPRVRAAATPTATGTSPAPRPATPESVTPEEASPPVLASLPE